MKRYIILVVSLLISSATFSQKYKDVYESLKTMSDNEAFQTLQEFSQSKKKCPCGIVIQNGSDNRKTPRHL